MRFLVPPPVVTAVTCGFMWTSARWFQHSAVFTPLKFALQGPLAVIFLVIGLLLMVLAAWTFTRAKTTLNPMLPERASSLVTNGIFRLSRNPIYLGDALLLVAYGIWLGCLANVAWLILFIGYIQYFQIIPEERALRQLFGQDYSEYCSRVRRWI